MPETQTVFKCEYCQHRHEDLEVIFTDHTMAGDSKPTFKKHVECPNTRMPTSLEDVLKANKRRALVVNLHAGPGAGKSTMAAHVFFLLKSQGINCELVREYAKDIVWERSQHMLAYQEHLFGEQFKRFAILMDQVDVIITDAPIMLMSVYGDHLSTAYKTLVREKHDEFGPSLDYYLQREKRFHEEGRVQTSEQATRLDTKVKVCLDKYGISHTNIASNEESGYRVLDDVLDWLKRND